MKHVNHHEYHTLSHGNDKDCAPFSRLCLELVTMQNQTDKIEHDTKEILVKRHT